MSAQETTPGHTFSTADLMVSTTSNPLAELAFGAAFFSPVNEDVSSRRIDPSHPCRKFKLIIKSKSFNNNSCHPKKTYHMLPITEVKHYIDKAVMEEQAKKRSAHPSFVHYRRINYPFHYWKNLWTSLGVEIRRKLS